MKINKINVEGIEYNIEDASIPEWSRQEEKPIYDYSEIDNTPTNVSSFENDAGYLTEHQDISSKEDLSNKVITLDANSTNAQYPSAKGVYDYVYNDGKVFYDESNVYEKGHPFDFKGKRRGTYFFRPDGNNVVEFYYTYNNIATTNGFIVDNMNNQYPKGRILDLNIIKPIEEITEQTEPFAVVNAIFGKGYNGDNAGGSFHQITMYYNPSTQTISKLTFNPYMTALDAWGATKQTIYTETVFNKIPSTSVAPSSGNHLTNKTYVDGNFVKLSGIQTITGTKVFSVIPKQNTTTAPTQDEEFTNKKYVDDQISAVRDYIDSLLASNGGQ